MDGAEGHVFEDVIECPIEGARQIKEVSPQNFDGREQVIPPPAHGLHGPGGEVYRGDGEAAPRKLARIVAAPRAQHNDPARRELAVVEQAAEDRRRPAEIPGDTAPLINLLPEGRRVDVRIGGHGRGQLNAHDYIPNKVETRDPAS